METSLPGTGYEPGEATGIAGEAGEFQVDSVDVRAIESDRVVLSAWQHDPVSQDIRGQMIDIGAGGIRLRPWRLHYRTAAQLDAAAADAGLELLERWADWRGGRFDPLLSTEQIAVYGRRR